jgi:asparagine synthase (glutamine-hydrolysing)
LSGGIAGLLGSFEPIAARDWLGSGVVVAPGGALGASGTARSFENARLALAWTGPLDPELFADRYRDGGAEALREILGRGALAALDKERRELLLAVDRFGIQTLYFCRTPSGLAFATTLGALRSRPGVRLEVDPQSVFNYVYFHMVPAPRAIFQGVERLDPSEYALARGGELTRRRYWKPRYDESAAGVEELSEEFRSRVRNAVRKCLKEARGKVGAFLSGGTDSSTVVGVLGELTGEAPRAYSIGFRTEGYDETGYARIAARHFGADHHEYVVSPKDVEEALPLLAEAYDEPFGNASAVASYYCARMAREDGVSTLLGGDGGDEVFAGNERYAKQAIFEYYARLPGVLRRGLLEPILGIAPENGFGLARKARGYVRKAATPLPDRLEDYNLVNRMSPEAIFTPELLSQVRPQEPIELLRRSYSEAETASVLNRLLYLDIKFTLADNDLRKVGGTCGMNGVEVLYPFLDPDLVDFANRIPPRLKLKGTKLRYLFKRASAGFLPDEILKKKKHGFGVPVARWMRDEPALRELAYESLRSLTRRGYLREDFAPRLIELHQGEHADYYGVMVYVLTMLELWHRKHAP